MELPAYHVPAWGNVLRATWERGWSFIKRAGTVILASTIILWFLQGFGFENGAFTMVEDQDNSILAIVASTISWIFIPQLRQLACNRCVHLRPDRQGECRRHLRCSVSLC